MNLDEARTEICRVGASLFARGYVHGTTGNISVRLADGYLITPTEACLGELDPAALAFIDPDGVHVDGEPASKAIALHRSVYDADNSARCIIHTHSKEVVAASFEEREQEGDLLPPITPYQVMKVGSTPVLHYSAPGSVATAERVGRLVTRRIREERSLHSVVLARLGPNVWHASPTRTMAVLEELEETALLWNRLHPSSLPAAAMQNLAERFGAAW